jgi:hypothetical protein
MIPENIKKEHIIKAINEIERVGTPDERCSRKYLLKYNDKYFPPKYTISLANKYVNGKELNSSEFSGGKETNDYLGTLGFKIVGKKSIIKSSKQRIEIQYSKNHRGERCPECKDTIKKLLENIYGEVRPDYKFEIKTHPENLRNTKYYEELKGIYVALQNHRGFKEFVKMETLPRCDFFVPNRRFIVEFDESQHFSLPRKITLGHYPEKLGLGFDKERWMKLCEIINAKDNDPPFRDEQRAWYDTLRDFVPDIKGINPTVRLYSKDFHWCSLNPNDPKDTNRFKNIIERNMISKRGNMKDDKTNWIATVILQSNASFGKTDNKSRRDALRNILNETIKRNKGDGVILFPGGYFNSRRRKAKTMYSTVSNQIKELLQTSKRNVVVCVGIDGRLGRYYPKDQLALAVNKKGIIPIARKFYPTAAEKDSIQIAPSHESLEDGKPRVFSFNGRRYSLAVCYDIFGIRKKSLPNPGVDVILNTVHQFTCRCKCKCRKKEDCKCWSASGYTDFARKGFAGASKEWGCPVFGSVSFLALHGKWRKYTCPIPPNWPSGVFWNQGKKDIKKWKYADNPLVPKEFERSIKEGKAFVRIYSLSPNT